MDLTNGEEEIMYTYEEGVNRVLEMLAEDYAHWANRAGITREEMIPSFIIESGRTYDKIVKVEKNGNTCSIGFIVKKDTKNFLKGDILKAASWSAPATNFSRGNVYSDKRIAQCVSWAGIQ
jgi:hypothetical protein